MAPTDTHTRSSHHAEPENRNTSDSILTPLSQALIQFMAIFLLLLFAIAFAIFLFMITRTWVQVRKQKRGNLEEDQLLEVAVESNVEQREYLAAAQGLDEAPPRYEDAVETESEEEGQWRKRRFTA